MENKPSPPAADPAPETPSVVPACDASACPRARRRWLLLSIALVALAFAVYAPGISNTALFHHVSSTVRDPLPDNSIVCSPALFAKIWGPEFLLMTRGEYRPLGYAAYSLLARVVPPESTARWHVLLIGLHALTALAVFAALRMLLGDWPGFALAAAYAVFPVLALLVNDVNQFYALVALFFSAASLAFFIAHMKSSRRLSLVLSLLAFAAAVFASPYALVVPALMMGAWAFVASPPRAVAVIVWIALVPFAALMLRQSAAVAILVPYVPAVIFALGSGRLRQVPRLLAILVPFAAVAAAYLSVAAAVKPLPIFALGRERISLVTEVAFIARLLLAPMPALAAALVLAVLMPLVFFWRWRPAAAAVVIVVIFMSIATVRINPAYADDVTYWKTLDSLVPGHPLLRFNVATALVAGARWEEARDELFYLHYEMPLTPPAGRVRWWYPERYEADRILVQATVLSKLGLVYRALGDDKVAGFYAFPKFLGWNSRVRKHRLVEIGDFCLAAGYVSWAENHYASCLIMDPYDVRLYNACGKCLMYKNFFRAAAKHFRHVLTLDADNETALYHLAFIAKHLNDPDGFAEYSRRWRIVAGVPEGEIDFQPILAAYRFDRDRMRMWFTADPVELLKFATDKTGQDEYYSVKWRGRAWEFSEVPLEAARYFIRRGQDENAYTYLKAALDANPRSQAALPLMVETCRKLGRADEAASHESTAAQEAQK